MKIKNLNINRKATSKLAACMLAGSLALTACGEEKIDDKNNILKGTILENTCVVTFEDGTKDIAIAIESCNYSQYPHYIV